MGNKIRFCKFNIIFNIIILLSYFVNSSKSLTFFPLDKAEVEEVLDNTFLLNFKIKGAVDSSIDQNITFQIQIEVYRNSELLSYNKSIDCLIPKNSYARFGTKVNSTCKFDLINTPLANKIKFTNFIVDSNIIKIDDRQNFILGNNIIFSRSNNITPNFEYIVEDIKIIKCMDGNLKFGILGEIDKIFVSSFNFNLIINQNSSIKALCESPYIYFTKKTMINCTLNISNNSDISQKIELKENYYKVMNEDGEKILKIKIGNNKDKMELKYLNCESDNKDNFTLNETKINFNNDTKLDNKENSSNIIEQKKEEDNNSISNFTDNDKDIRENKTSIDYNKTNNDVLNNSMANASNIEIKNITKENISYTENNSSNITLKNFTNSINQIKNDEQRNITLEFYNETINKTKIETINDTRENDTSIEKENITLIQDSVFENNTNKNDTNKFDKFKDMNNNTLMNITEKNNNISIPEKETNLTVNQNIINFNKSGLNITEKEKELKDSNEDNEINIKENENNKIKENYSEIIEEIREKQQLKHYSDNNFNEVSNNITYIEANNITEQELNYNQTKNETFNNTFNENNETNIIKIDNNTYRIESNQTNKTKEINKTNELNNINELDNKDEFNNTNELSDANEFNKTNELNNINDLNKTNEIYLFKNGSQIENKYDNISINNGTERNESVQIESEKLIKNNTNFDKYVKKSNRSEYQDNNTSYNNYTNSIDIRNNTKKDMREKWKRIFGNKKGTKIGNEFEKDEERQRRWEKEKEEEKRRKKEEEEREKEEERRRKEQEEISKIMREREREKERERKEKEERERFENLRNKKNDDNFNNHYIIKYEKELREFLNQKNINAKLIHIQFRYSDNKIYYMFYSLTQIPKGHRIKIKTLISKYNDNTGIEESENKYLILKADNEIDKNGRNIVVEYSNLFECKNCVKIMLYKSDIEGATVYNIPEEQSLIDAIAVNKNNYLSRNSIKSPLLYITENISNRNCLINLEGYFFNKDKFFISKFNLNLIDSGYANTAKKNKTISCGLNERSIFTCTLNENIDYFEYKLEQFIIDKKENIIIDNSLILEKNNINNIKCTNLNIENNKNKENINKNKENTNKNNKINVRANSKKFSKKKKIIMGIILLIILLYLIVNCCCNIEKEEYNNYSSSSRGTATVSNYVGETSGLLNRRW